MVEHVSQQRRPGAPPTITRGEMLASTAKAQQDIKKASPNNNYGLGMAKVLTVDYEGFTVTLRTLVGAGQFDRVPVPLTFPGAGNRHFLGTMPMPGDYCVIGWTPQEVTGGTKTPVILAWMVPGVWPGRDWATTADFEVGEFDMDAPADRTAMTGAHERIRHKLRHMQPGNVVASSAQGADLVLDEGVMLANRRGNEIRLRDQDQAFIVRSLQQFHAMAGARIYAGMVQRDATFLPEMMVSDGKLWDGGTQADDGEPVSDQHLPDDPQALPGFLTPTKILRKARDGGMLGQAFLPHDDHLDPYQFLRRGGFINEAGHVVDGRHKADAVYGGKPIYRVATQDTSNPTVDPDAPTLTEYRIEVVHTSTGRLPVTEQTDLFDADRLPASDSYITPAALPPNAPFIEWVLGSVVGNDPYSQEGRRKYGVPLRAVIFDGDDPSPRLESVELGVPGSHTSPTAMKDQAATLFRMTPPTDSNTPGSFWSVNKQGQMRASFGGDPAGNSVEAHLHGGLKLSVGGRFQLLMNGHVELGTRSKSSLKLTAQEGSVRIYGGGPVKDGSSLGDRVSGVGRGEGDLPAVDIEARTNVQIKAEKRALVKANEIELNATSVHLLGHESVTLDGVRKTSVSTENFQLTVNGKAQESFGGPKYLLPTNFPLHERTYAPVYPGVCEKVIYALGDREEEFYLGNHKTTILVGNMTYRMVLGTWTAEAVGSKLTMGASGITGTAAAGPIALTAVGGAAVMSGTTGVSMVSSAGTATVRGQAGVYLGGPISGPDAGPIVCAGSLEPFTGLPFSTWGIGAKGHVVGG